MCKDAPLPQKIAGMFIVERYVAFCNAAPTFHERNASMAATLQL